MTNEFPTGLITLVFTDLEGSSELSARHGATFEAARMEHFEVLREAARRWNGCEVETAGDALFVVFASASDAIAFAALAQIDMEAHGWPPEINTLRVRIGLHSGEPFVGTDRGRATYRGPVTNTAARVQAAAHGGQILVSGATYALAQAALPPYITFHDCGMHRLKGVGEEHLWQVCHAALRREFPPLHTLTPERHNLPVPSTSLIGRDAEVSAWRELLKLPTTRLLTLAAMGGMGKSRAALQLAELCVQDSLEGVWWTSLEEARSADSMIARIAASLRLHLQAQSPVREQLHAYLRDRNLLLVLDNTEQIPEAPGVVNDLLQAAPHTKCLVTSRRTLGLNTEILQEVLPLPLVDAQRLFVERAHSRRPDFELNAGNAADIAELCRRLEGVPLALELAASRIAVSSPREILSRLDQQFRLLQTRSPDLPPRQRALRGAIDWSFDLLEEEDKALFAQISVFVRGFTFDDAEAVCDSSLDIFEGLEELRRQSLLRVEIDAATQQTRFFMMGSVRAYAAEKLGSEAEIDRQTRLRHAEHFRRLAQDYVSRLRTRHEIKARQAFEANSDNVRAAMDWAQANDQGQLCAEIALDLGIFLERRGLTSEAVRRVEAGLQAAQRLPAEAAHLSAELWRERASLYIDQMEPANVHRCALQALHLFEQLSDAKGQADAYNLLGLAAKRAGDFNQARRFLGLALDFYPQSSHEMGVAIVYTNLGAVECEDRAGDRVAAAEHLQKALHLRRGHEDQHGTAEVLNNLGVLHQEQGDLAQARRFYEEALHFESELRNMIGVSRALYNLGEIAEAQGDLPRARRLAAAAEHLFDEMGSPLQHYATELRTRLEAQLALDEAGEPLRRDFKDQSLDEIIAWALGT